MKRLLGFLLLLAGLAIGALVWNESRYPVFKSTSGFTLAVRAIRLGTNSTYRTHPRLWQKFYERTPYRWQRWLGNPPIEGHDSMAVGATLWCQLTPPNPPSSNPQPLPHLESLSVLIDGQWVIMPSHRSHITAQTATLTGYGLGVLPRREKYFVFSAEFDGRTNQWTMKNPWYGRTFPKWTPQPLPQTQQSNGLTFTLERILGNGNFWTPQLTLPSVEPPPSHPWEQRWSVIFSDPTGNRSPTGLSLNEKVWRVDLDYRVPADLQWPGRPTVSLGSFQKPDPLEAHEITVTPELKSLGIQFSALVGPGRFTAHKGVITNRVSFEPKTPKRSIMHLGNDWSWQFGDSEMVLALFLRGSPGLKTLVPNFDSRDSPVAIRLRTQDGSIYIAKPLDLSRNTDGKTVTCPWSWVWRDLPPNLGKFDIEIVRNETWRFEYVIAAPSIDR